MNTILQSPELRAEWFQRLREGRHSKIRLAALLVTVGLHGLLFWWGMNSARLGPPSPAKISAIRVFLQPLALPELATPRPHRVLPPAATRPVAPPAPLLLPKLAVLPPPSAPATPATSPAPVMMAAPEVIAKPEVAVSLAPLPVAPGVVPAPTGAVAAAINTNAQVGRESGAANLAPSTTTASGGGQNEAAVTSAPGAAGSGSGAAGTGKELYLRALFAHIEAHKYYPPSARRRQLEGQVRVAFTIEPDGGISGLKASEGHPQLQEAALQTVHSALPLPLPAAGVTLPFSLSYRMDFRLR